MRRGWAVFVALILLAGCGGQATPDQTGVKEAYIRQLVGFCAEVDRQLAAVDPNVQPGRMADQFDRFAKQARAQVAPAAERQELDTLLTDIDRVVQHFRAAETARSAGNDAAYRGALAQAMGQLKAADAAAQEYGMPPLNDCPKHVSPAPTSPKSTTTPPPPTAAWQLRRDSLVAVQQTGAAVVGGRIWVPGGLTGAVQATAKTEVYDPTLDSWDPGPSLPYAVHHAMVVSYRNQPVVIGGFMSQGADALAVTTSRVLTLKGDRWVSLPELRYPRAAGAAVVVGNKIVVVGGRTGHPEQLVAPTEVYDGTGWHDGTAIPVPGDHLAAASDGTYLYVVGGRRFKASSNTAAVQRYDPNTGRWTSLPAIPKPVSGAGAAVVDGQLIVVGGESTTSAFATVQAYDLTTPTSRWTTLPDLTRARHGLAVTAIGKTLYAIDGAAQPGHTASTRTVETLTFS